MRWGTGAHHLGEAFAPEDVGRALDLAFTAGPHADVWKLVIKDDAGWDVALAELAEAAEAVVAARPSRAGVWPRRPIGGPSASIVCWRATCATWSTRSTARSVS